MNKTEEVIGHLLSNSQHVSAMVTDDTEVWETHNKLVEHIRELDRKAKAFDAYHGTIQSHLHLKGEPEFSNPATEVLSDLIDVHDDYENKGGQKNE